MIEPPVETRHLDLIEHRQRRGTGDGVAAQRGGRPDIVAATEPFFTDEIHDVAAAAVGAERMAATKRFAVGHEVGYDAVPLLRPAHRKTKPGDDLVEDQDHAVRRTGDPHRVEKPGGRRQAAMERLHDHGGEFVGMPRDQVRRRRRVVERSHENEARLRGRNARAERLGVWPWPHLLAEQARRAEVVLPVVRPLKLEDAAATANAAGQPQALQRGFAARRTKPHLVAGGAERDESLGEFE